MPWQFQLADGRTLEYPDEMPYEEALQRARRENNPNTLNRAAAAAGGMPRGPGIPDVGQAVGSVLQAGQDLGDKLQAGWGNLEHTAGGIANWFGGIINPGGIEAIRSRGEQTGGDQLQARGTRDREEALASLSPEGAHAFTPHTGESWLENLSPARAAGGLAESAIPLAPAIAASILSGGTVDAAGGTAAAANVASQLGMAGAFGLGGAGDVDSAIDEKVRAFAAQSPDDFIHSRLGQEALRRTDGDYARAVEVAAHLAKGIIPTTAGVLEGIIGYYGVNPFKRGIESAVERTFVRDLLNNTIGGAGTMAAFAGVGTGASNVGAAQVNPEQNLLEGVPESMAQGAEAGAILGLGSGLIEGMKPRAVRPTIEGGVRTHGARTTDTTSASDAEFYDTRMLPPPEGAARAPEEPPAAPTGGGAAETPPNAEAASRAEEYARRAPTEDESLRPTEEDDATRAETIRDMASSLGRAVTEVPGAPAGATRTAEPVPLYGLGTRFGEGHAGEADDTLSHQIYSHAVRNGLTPADTETFKAYSELFEGQYPEPPAPGAAPTGFGIRIVDRLPNGETATHVVATPATSLEEAAAFARAHNGNKVVSESAAATPTDSAVAERPASATAPAEPAFTPDVAAIRPKRRTTARDFTDGLLSGQVRGASISDGRFELLLGTEGHAAETGTDTARYAQLAKSGDVEITSSPATKNRQPSLNIRVTPDAKPENVKQAIAVFQRAAKDGIAASVGLHTADQPHGVIINDHSEALKTLRDIAQRNPSVSEAPKARVEANQPNELVSSSPETADNNVVTAESVPTGTDVVPGKSIPNVPTNIGRIYQDGGYEALRNSLGKANVMQIRSAAKRFGIKLQPKSSRDSVIDQLARHFESRSRFNPPQGTRLRPGRGLPETAPKRELAPQAIERLQTARKRSVMGETDAFSVKRPSRLSPKERAAQEERVAQQTTPAEPAREQRTLPELKDELRRLNGLEDDAYVEAARKANFSKEEVATVEGAIQAGDKEAWNLRDVLSDVKRKPKASVNQTRAETAKKTEERTASTAQRKKAREMTDSYLASSIAKGQPSKETAIKAARDYVEMQRARGLSGKNAWTMTREQNLIERVGKYFDQAAPGKESFTPPRKGKGENAPLDPKWVSEMQEALKAAAECAAGSLGASVSAIAPAALSDAIIGTGLGAAAAAPIAIAGASLYHTMPSPAHEGAVPFRSVALDHEGYVDPVSVLEEPAGYANNPTTGHPLFAPPGSAPEIPVDNSEVGDRLIEALDLPRRKGPPE